MLDISASVSTGIVDNLRFMGTSHKESIQAPVGLLRQDVNLSSQLQEYHRRQFVMQEYRNLLSMVRGSPVEHEERPPSPGGMAGIANNSLSTRAPGKSSPQESSRRQSSTSPSDAPLPRMGHAPADLLLMSSQLSINSNKDRQSPALDVVGKSGDSRAPSRLSAMTDPTPADSRVNSNVASANMDDSRRLASSLFRAALSLHERYVPCYYCAKDVLHEEFSRHVTQCKITTEALMRKKFLNPLRYTDFVPQVPIPPLNCSDDMLDEYSMECSKCIGKSLVDCTICKRKYNIHELQDHWRKCTGRSSGEVLGNYAAYLPSKSDAK
jgi:hypothetical protein